MPAEKKFDSYDTKIIMAAGSVQMEAAFLKLDTASCALLLNKINLFSRDTKF